MLGAILGKLAASTLWDPYTISPLHSKLLLPPIPFCHPSSLRNCGVPVLYSDTMTTPIPQPRGVPLLGNIFDMDPNNTWVSLKKLTDKYGTPPLPFSILEATYLLLSPGKIFKITALGQQIVFVASVALLKEICDQKRFRKCVTEPIVKIRHTVQDALFAAYDDEPNVGSHLVA
jgi:hypothetical protein